MITSVGHDPRVDGTLALPQVRSQLALRWVIQYNLYVNDQGLDSLDSAEMAGIQPVSAES